MNVMVRMSKLDPAYSVISKFDGKDATGKKRGTIVLAERLGLTRSAVAKWTLPPKDGGNGGTGGYIPSRYYKQILAFAEEIGVSIDPSEFVTNPNDAEAA